MKPYNANDKKLEQSPALTMATAQFRKNFFRILFCQYTTTVSFERKFINLFCRAVWKIFLSSLYSPFNSELNLNLIAKNDDVISGKPFRSFIVNTISQRSPIQVFVISTRRPTFWKAAKINSRLPLFYLFSLPQPPHRNS